MTWGFYLSPTVAFWIEIWELVLHLDATQNMLVCPITCQTAAKSVPPSSDLNQKNTFLGAKSFATVPSELATHTHLHL